jgi:hypothetical protein
MGLEEDKEACITLGGMNFDRCYIFFEADPYLCWQNSIFQFSSDDVYQSTRWSRNFVINSDD